MRAARRPRDRVLVGPYARLLVLARTPAPALVRRTVTWRTDKAYFGGASGGEAGSGTLDAPAGRPPGGGRGRRAGRAARRAPPAPGRAGVGRTRAG
ncbi:hypothetical protein GCM10017750_01130 [Streptomyces racemochromogenes]